jgi:hypothetical protein
MICAQDFNPVISLKKAIENTTIQYTKCNNSQQFNFAPFPIQYKQNQQPHNPTIMETFILRIPHGKVYSQDGIIIEKDNILKDLIWQNDVSKKISLEYIDIQSLPNPTKIIGKVAVIAQNGQFCYYHWMTEVLGRLLLLESQNITYDYLFAPLSAPYMQESLKLLGIDLNKVIEPYKKHTYIQADELIVPSLINQIYPTPILSSYPSPEIIDLLRKKLLPIIKSCKEHNQHIVSKKIFISRKDAIVRKLTNEDELFEKLAIHGFERYCLSKLSLLEQITLFNHADTIIALHGAGLTNLIFSNPGTKVIEIFQARADATYWYASQTLGLNHTCIQTCEFDQKENVVGFFDTIISETAIDSILDIVHEKNMEKF